MESERASDPASKHEEAMITASLEPVKKLCAATSDALKQLDVRLRELDDQEVAIVASVRQHVTQLQELLEKAQAEHIEQIKQAIQEKRTNLAAQKDELATVLTKLDSCLTFVNDSLRTGSQGDVMKIKETVTKQIREATDNFKPDLLPPCEEANLRFLPSLESFEACQKIGEIIDKEVCPEKCYATGKGLEVAITGERATAVLEAVDHKGNAFTKDIGTPTGELVSETTGVKTECSVKKTGESQYEISYQPARRGRHQLHIKVEGDHINGSPFGVTVAKKFGAPLRIISGVYDMKKPWGVAINQKGEIIVTEGENHCVLVFNETGKLLRSFGSEGSGRGQFKSPQGVAVDDDGNILVADEYNGRIQKLTSDGKFITAVGKKGYNALEFKCPVAVAINPLNKKVYVVDCKNQRVQILNPDLTFYKSFGNEGSDGGQFRSPYDVALDSTGQVYVADMWNNRIQVFTAEGEYVRSIGKKDSGHLNRPTGIAIDGDDLVYVTERNYNLVSVYTSIGRFVTSFGSRGKAPGQFDFLSGVAVDKNGVVYVCDTNNCRLQYF